MKYLLLILLSILSYSQNSQIIGKWKSIDNWAQIEFFPDYTCIIIEKNKIISPKEDCIWNEKECSITYIYKGRNTDKIYFKYENGDILIAPNKRKLNRKKAKLILKKLNN
ncbi:hypothetical protein [Nautilia lithotrophica]